MRRFQIRVEQDEMVANTRVGHNAALQKNSADEFELLREATSQFSARLIVHSSVSPGDSGGNIQGNKCGAASGAQRKERDSFLVTMGLHYSPHTLGFASCR